MQILILNGPNLNLLGKREPGIYGNQDFQSFYEELTAVYDDVASFRYEQSNVEGELIDLLQEADGAYDAIVLNAGGYAVRPYGVFTVFVRYLAAHPPYIRLMGCTDPFPLEFPCVGSVPAERALGVDKRDLPKSRAARVPPTASLIALYT